MHKRSLAALLCLTLLLGGCTSTQRQITDSGVSATLPPASQPYTAPVGDAALDYTAQVELMLPSRDHSRLLAQAGAADAEPWSTPGRDGFAGAVQL